MEYRVEKCDNFLQLYLQGENCYRSLASICYITALNCNLAAVDCLLVDFREVEVHGLTSPPMFFAFGFAESYKQITSDCSRFKLVVVEGGPFDRHFEEEGLVNTACFFGMSVFMTNDYDQALEWLENECAGEEHHR